MVMKKPSPEASLDSMLDGQGKYMERPMLGGPWKMEWPKGPSAVDCPEV